jgi:hypothetical protein
VSAGPPRSLGTFATAGVSHLGMATAITHPARPRSGIQRSCSDHPRPAVTAIPVDPRDHAVLASVTALLDDTASSIGDPNGELARLRASLSQPLTMAVAGHTSAGKSTLVNALIGHQIAPTAATECTRVITWYRFGPEHPQILCKDGSRQPLWFTDEARRHGLRQLPEQLPVPEESVDRLDVPLDFEALRHVTVIDSPGLSGDEGLAGETEALLATGAVDVLLFVLGGSDVRGSEHDTLSTFRRNTRGRLNVAGNCLGVLSRADTYPGPDPMASARAVAEEHSSELKGLVAGVIPVMGRIAATMETGSFNQAHTDALQTIAALPDQQRISMLRTATRFLDSATLTEEQLTRGQRVSLVERLGIYGIRTLTQPEYAAAPTAVMYDTMRRMSGIDQLRARINALFVRPRLTHKALRALADVQTLATSAARGHAREVILDRIDEVRHGPEMHGVNELRALSNLYSGAAVIADPSMRSAALRLFEGTTAAERLGCRDGDPADAVRSARVAVSTWQSFANTAMDGAVGDLARTAARSAHLIDQRLQRGGVC